MEFFVEIKLIFGQLICEESADESKLCPAENTN